jgi:cytochrome P450
MQVGSLKTIIVSSAELTKEFLKTNDGAFSARHAFNSIDYMSYYSSFAFAPFGNFVKVMRKFSITKLMGSQTILQLEPLRTKEMKHFLLVFYKKSKLGEPVNVGHELMKLTNNIIAQMIWSTRPTDMDSEESWTIVRDTTQVFGELNVCNMIPFFKYVDFQGFVKKYKSVHKRFDGLVERVITDRQELRRKRKTGEVAEAEEGVKDFLELMLDLMEDENSELELSRIQLKALILDFITAGTDSAAIAIEWALAELINQPELLRRAQKELDEIVGKDRLVKEADCQNLPFIQAIIKETFRLHPPIPLLERKAIEPCEVSGYKISVGTLVFVNVWAMGRDPKYWKNPMEFNPDRFLKTDTFQGEYSHIDVKGQHFQYLPFGTGRRVCVAIPLALQELYTALASMIQCFDYKVVDRKGNKVEALDMSEKPGITAPMATDLLCIPTQRMTNYDFLAI